MCALFMQLKLLNYSGQSIGHQDTITYHDASRLSFDQHL